MLINILRPYILGLVSIFIALDIIGNIPLFITLTEKLSHKQKRKVIQESILYIILTAVILILIARYLLQFIGITSSDFKIAAGIILLSISINLVVAGRPIKLHSQHRHHIDFGLFPLLMPLFFGPALFTMSLSVMWEFGIVVTALALAVNMFLVWLVLEKSEVIYKIIGFRGSIFFSKISEILLISIAVMLIRQGLTSAFFK